MLEKDIEARLKRGVERAGGLCLKWVSPGCTGVMDRIAMLNGPIRLRKEELIFLDDGTVLVPLARVSFIELKKPRGRESERQKYMARKMSALGLDVRCLWNNEQVDDFLREVSQGAVRTT